MASKSVIRYVAAALLGVAIGGFTHTLHRSETDEKAPRTVDVEVTKDDLDATLAHCRSELRVSSRDIDAQLALSQKDLAAAWVKSGTKGLVCIRAVVDGKIVDSTLSPPATYAIDSLTAEGMYLLHSDHTYLVIGEVSEVPETSESEGAYLVTKATANEQGQGNPVGLLQGGGFMAVATDPRLGGDGTGITFTVIGEGARKDLNLGNADWAAIS